MIETLLRGGGTNIHSFHDITSFDNIVSAWQKFSHDKQKKQDVIEFKLHLMDNLYQIHIDLQNKTYVHGDYSHFIIIDPKKRDIHKSSVRDRIVHHMLYDALYPYFDSKFIHDSYSCRIGKGTHRALQQFQNYFRKVSRNDTRTCWVLKCDIRKFFATIDHEILKQILRSHIDDGDTIGLLENIIDSFCSLPPLLGGGAEVRGGGGVIEIQPHPIPPLRKGGENTNTTGLPLGNLTSQLLVNIYMNKFDQFVKHQLKQKYYIRYADDFVFLADNKNELKELLPRVREFLWEQLRLELHPDKVFIKTVVSGVDFLGWIHFSNHRVLRTATKRRMIRNLKDNPKVESIASYKGMLSYGNAWKLQKKYLNNNFCIFPPLI
jgi:RNA-directed DNA polymerase